jgi:hypothetical protein
VVISVKRTVKNLQKSCTENHLWHRQQLTPFENPPPPLIQQPAQTYLQRARLEKLRPLSRTHPYQHPSTRHQRQAHTLPRRPTHLHLNPLQAPNHHQPHMPTPTAANALLLHAAQPHHHFTTTSRSKRS